MAEHHELVAEMAALEQMGTQERQKLAKKRRLQQLKKWGQREKEWLAKEKQLNKRLASKLQEENNGLNLKQYTTFSSNHRSKKKLQLSAAASNGDLLNNNTNSKSLDHSLDGKHQVTRYLSVATNGIATTTTTNELAPNGRVHFNVGVMLLEAAARNDFDEVKRLLMLGVSPDSVNHDGLTALHQCCIDASEPMMNILLEFGANVDARDTEQWTPLHAACTCGHLNLVKILVENGADLLAVNGDGNMPFDICEDEATLDYIESQMVNRGITQEMIDFTRASTEMQMISDLERQVAEGIDLNAANEQGVTQLHVAAANGYLSAVKFLLKHDVNVNACDNDLWRPLHGAACWGNEQHTKVIELLVEGGAHLDAKTINDETVFDLCDNVALLERLNQLKDEIESKQALGSDRLRRTQSRTNSRVHSVRRTSVRDKNQISRREAREEALLRVDSSQPSTLAATIPPANTMSNGQQPTTPAAVDDKSQLDDQLLVTTNNQEEKQEHLKQELAPSDQVDGHHNSSSENDVATKPKQTDLDHQEESDEDTSDRPNNANHINEKNNVIITRSQNSSAHTSSDSIAQTKRKPSEVAQSQTVASNIATTLVNDKDQVNVSITTGKSLNGTSPGSLSSAPNNQQQLLSQVNIVKTNEKSSAALRVKNIEARESQRQQQNDDDSCDDENLSLQSQQHQPPPVQAHMVPINYTLSNLKKQRSDLRMRTTSIGGNNNNNTTMVNSMGRQKQQVVLDPQPATGLLQANGLHHRPESPSLTFRKFRGEPSEVIGGAERNDRRKCCILI